MASSTVYKWDRDDIQTVNSEYAQYYNSVDGRVVGTVKRNGKHQWVASVHDDEVKLGVYIDSSFAKRVLEKYFNRTDVSSA